MYLVLYAQIGSSQAKGQRISSSTPSEITISSASSTTITPIISASLSDNVNRQKKNFTIVPATSSAKSAAIKQHIIPPLKIRRTPAATSKIYSNDEIGIDIEETEFRDESEDENNRIRTRRRSSQQGEEEEHDDDGILMPGDNYDDQMLLRQQYREHYGGGEDDDDNQEFIDDYDEGLDEEPLQCPDLNLAEMIPKHLLQQSGRGGLSSLSSSNLTIKSSSGIVGNNSSSGNINNPNSSSNSSNLSNNNNSGNRLEAPYQCNICFKRYVHACTLVQHRKVHQGVTQCKCCGQILSNLSNLRAHYQTVHGKTPAEVQGKYVFNISNTDEFNSTW